MRMLSRTALAALIVSTGCATTAHAAASRIVVFTASSGAPAALGEHGLATKAYLEAAQRLSEHGLSVEAEEDVPFEVAAQTVEQLSRGLDAVPEQLRSPPGGPLVFRIHSSPSAFGMGTGEKELPDWSDGGRVFHLYAHLEPDDARAAFRVQALSRGEREELWRRRAVVHAIVARWDRLLHWSGSSEWARITGWVEPGSNLLAVSEHPTNSYEWAYSRARGMQSAALDFATFAEELLVTPDSVHPGAVPVDDRVECQEFGKARVLSASFAKLLPESLRVPWRRPVCPAFDEFADLPHLSGVELILSAPSGIRPQSLFGHLMIRPVFGADSERPFEMITEVAALTGFRDPAVEYAVRGVVGGYPIIFDNAPMARARTEASDSDERTLRRFKLNLSAVERERLMERLWELERRGYHRYYFFSDNCASFVAFALNGALEEGHVIPLNPVAVMPTAVLDAAARIPTQGSNGAPVPLLVDLNDDILSHRVNAVIAERELRADAEALGELVPQLASRWSAFVRSANDSSVECRIRAQADLLPLGEDTIAAVDSEEVRRRVLDASRATVLLQRYAGQAADETLRKLDVARVVIPRDLHVPTADELMLERQKRFQHDTGVDRTLETIRDYLRFSDLMQQLPRRPWTPAETERIAVLQKERQAFIALSAADGELRDRLARERQAAGSSVDGWSSGATSVAAADHAPPLVAEGGSGGSLAVDAPSRSNALRFAGLWRLEVGGGVATQNEVTPGLLLRGALLREQLGERRELSIDRLVGIRLADSEALWTFAHGLPTPARVTLVPIDFITVPREPSLMRRSLFDSFGFSVGAYARYVDPAERTQPAPSTRYALHADAVLPLAATPTYDRHLVLLGGLVAQSRGNLLPADLGAGPSLALGGRWSFDTERFSALVGSVRWSAPWTAVGPASARGFGQRVEFDASFETELAAQTDWLVRIGCRAEFPIASSEAPDIVATAGVEWP